MNCEFCGGPVVSTEQVHGQTICESCLDREVQEAMERAFNRYKAKHPNKIRP